MQVVALGGNALSKSAQEGWREQFANALKCARLIKRIGRRLIVTHGNGPQVGNLLLQQRHGVAMPLHACVAMSQALIGDLLQSAFAHFGIKSVVLVTHVVVRADDAAFRNPTKPIGPYYKKRIFKNMIRQRAGWRRVVASPRPIDIVESDLITTLARKGIVIAGGGGGIAVVKRRGGFEPVDCVVDKDYTATLLGRLSKSHTLWNITNVEGVYVNFGTADQQLLRRLRIDEAVDLLKSGQLGVGSMAPKVEAAIDFIRWGGKRVWIGNSTNPRGTLIKG